MSNSSLKSLKIEHLRGSVVPFTLNFETGKKLTVIYGENGTGKTTICDALEFISKGKIGSLENRGLGGKVNSYWPSLGKKASDINVTLDTHGSSCSAQLVKSNVVVNPPDKKPTVEVLRRGQILGLVEAKPAERYNEIKRFIDVRGAESSEASLRELIRNLEKSRDTAVARVQENETTISQFWATAGSQGENALSWAKSQAEQDLEAVEKSTKDLINLKAAYSLLQSYPPKYKQIKTNIAAAKTKLTETTANLQAALSKTADGAGELIEVLQAAKTYIGGKSPLEFCPLCESAEKASGLEQAIDLRLGQFQELSIAKQHNDSATKILGDNESMLARLRSDATTAASDFETKKSKVLPNTQIKTPDNPAPAELEKLEGWLKNSSTLPEEWEKLENEWKSLNKFVETLRQAIKTYETNYQEQKKLDVLLPQLKDALEIITKERIAFTDSILKKIADDVGKIYEKVHPGEGLDKISLELDPDKRASLEIGTSFGGQDNAPPQAYFSQSHLDTLGLCVFLALSGREKPEETILVLDDVLASIDEPHVDRLILMLYSEALKFQHCIITTHYGPWKHKLRWGWLANRQCHFVELDKWSLTAGLKQNRSIPDIERLKTLLAESPPDPQLVCAKAGVVLEAALDFITQLYECHMPRKQDNRYTIGDYLPAIDWKLKTALRVEVASNDDKGIISYTSISLTPIIDELMRIAQARNIFGAHFNELSFTMLDSDAIGFGEKVLQLIEVLVDKENGWPRNQKSGSYWATHKETRRLHPLKRPA